MTAGDRAIRILATADNHLGRYYERMAPDPLNRRRAYLRRGFSHAVDTALERRADLFLHAGDLFDTVDPRNLERNFVARELRRLAENRIPAVAIGGNHDSPRSAYRHGGRAPQEVYAELRAMHWLDGDRRIDSVTFDLAGCRVAVGGIGWDPTALPGQDPLDGLSWEAEADVRILLLHGSVERYALAGRDEPYVRLATLAGLSARPLDLVVAGHLHRFGYARLGGTHLVVPGATERMTFGGQEGEPSCAWIELWRDGAHVESVAVPHQPRYELRLRTTELPETGIADWLIERFAPHAGPETLMKLHLEGPITRERYHALELRRVYEAGATRCAAFEVDCSGLELVGRHGERFASGVRVSQAEAIREVAQGLIAEATDDAERSLIAEARDRLLARYGGGGT